MILKERACYLADGSGVLDPQPVNLEWLEGAYVEIPWQLRRANNAPKDLTGAPYVLISFRYHEKDLKPFLTIPATITDAVNGRFRFIIPLKQALLLRGFYLYEVTLQNTLGQFEPVVPMSRVQIRPYDATSGALTLVPVYFGSDTAPVTIDEAFVTGLPETANAEARFRTIAYSSGAGEFGWYSYPASFGGTADDFFDTDTDLEAGVTLVATILVGGVSYFVWRTDVAGLGAWTMEAR